MRTFRNFRVFYPIHAWCAFIHVFNRYTQHFLNKVKRSCENPKRSLRIWMLDVSKQGISTFLLHFLNLFLAITISKENDEDACVWYLVNILLDTSIGILFQYLLIRIMEVVARKNQIDTLISGCYYSINTREYSDYTIDYSIWAAQAGIWCLISSLMKFFVAIIMLSFPDALEDIGMSLLQSVAAYPRLELLFVMVIVPFLTNCTQYWVTDNFLKESDESRIERLSRGKEKLISVGPEFYENQGPSIQPGC